ncbi:MAG: radical SAM protein [Geopsychrobacter sp.]|nr:radical SAM protein [Geopsychrobacter sp.]
MAGLYIHTPFCTQKCSYCDFFSAPPIGNQLKTWHLLIQHNLELIATELSPEIDSIFFGGGTPSLLTPDQISKILASCYKLFPISTDAEISLEANPATLNNEILTGFHAAGINRLSIGVQSFDDNNLHLLERKHSVK